MSFYDIPQHDLQSSEFPPYMVPPNKVPIQPGGSEPVVKSTTLKLGDRTYKITVEADSVEEADDLLKQAAEDQAKKHFADLATAYKLGVATSKITFEIDQDLHGHHSVTAWDLQNNIREHRTFKNETGRFLEDLLAIPMQPQTEADAEKKAKYQAITNVFQSLFRTPAVSSPPPSLFSGNNGPIQPGQESQSPSVQNTPHKQKEKIVSPEKRGQEGAPAPSHGFVFSLSSLENTVVVDQPQGDIVPVVMQSPSPVVMQSPAQELRPSLAPGVPPPPPVPANATLESRPDGLPQPPPSLEAFPEMAPRDAWSGLLTDAQYRALREAEEICSLPPLPAMTDKEKLLETDAMWTIYLDRPPFLPSLALDGELLFQIDKTIKDSKGNTVSLDGLVSDLQQKASDLNTAYTDTSPLQRFFKRKIPGRVADAKKAYNNARKALLKILTAHKEKALEKLQALSERHYRPEWEKLLIRNKSSLGPLLSHHEKGILADKFEIPVNYTEPVEQPDHLKVSESLSVVIEGTEYHIKPDQNNPTYKQLIENIKKLQQAGTSKKIKEIKERIQRDIRKLLLETEIERLKDILNILTSSLVQQNSALNQQFQELKGLIAFLEIKNTQFSIQNAQINVKSDIETEQSVYVNEFRYLADQLQFYKDDLVRKNVAFRTELKNDIYKKLETVFKELINALPAEEIQVLDQQFSEKSPEELEKFLSDIQMTINTCRQKLIGKANSAPVPDNDPDLQSLQISMLKLKYLQAKRDSAVIERYDPAARIIHESLKGKNTKKRTEKESEAEKENEFIRLARTHAPASFELYVQRASPNKKTSDTLNEQQIAATNYLAKLKDIKTEMNKAAITIESAKRPRTLPHQKKGMRDLHTKKKGWFPRGKI